MPKTFIHPTAEVQSGAHVGEGTRVWQHVVVLAGARIGDECNLNAHCVIEGGAVVGDRVTLKCGVYLWDGVILEDDVFIGPNATFTNDPFPRSRRPLAKHPRLLVRCGASIGAHAVLVAPVVVGQRAMVGAGAVVTRDVPARALVFGNPARQHGWVCDCGAKLDDSLNCPTCGSAYFKSDEGISFESGAR